MYFQKNLKATLIYLSFFFGLGIDAIIKKTKDYLSNNLNLSKKL